MKINGYGLLGLVLGLGFAALLIKLFLAPEDGWWEIIEQMVRGIVPQWHAGCGDCRQLGEVLGLFVTE